MKCESVREQLTAYLDGELTGDRGSAVRGHLRGCDACRDVATNEAALRDGLRSLPHVDPPASLWTGVQARLAAAEVADAEKPAWRRAVTRWIPRSPQLAFGSVAVAAAIIFLVVRHREPDRTPQAISIAPVIIKAEQQQVTPAPTKPVPPNDVTAQVAAEPAELTQGYADTVKELREMAAEERATWSDDKKRELDTQLAAFDKEITSAKSDRVRQKSYRAQIRFLQHALIVDEVALASGGPQ
jgi:anti-sigma factor RsiW